MKYFIFLLFMPALSASQTLDITYSLDTVGGKDSFFLVETVTKSIAESTRPQTTETSILFKDTTELVAYIERMKSDRASLSTRITQMQAQLTLLDSRIIVIQGLRDSVLPLLGDSVSRSVARPSPVSRQEVVPVAPIVSDDKAVLPKKTRVKKVKKQ